MMNIFSPLQLVWVRITFNRVTTIYTLNALTYCIVMVLCQVSLWNMNVYAGDLGKAIMAQTNLSASKFVYLEAHTGVLRLCENNHDALTPDKSCSIVWDPKVSPFTNSTTIQFPPSSDPRPVDTDAKSNKKKRYVEIEKTLDGQGLINGVRVAGLHLDQFATGAAHQAQHLKDTVIADLTCVQALKWPVQIVLQGKREDVLLTAFQIWVLGMSLMAVLNESIPHIFGAYIAHVLAIIWCAFQIWETANFKSEYLKATLDGACGTSGLDFLTQYFDPRTKFGIAMGVINTIALFSSGLLTYKLFHLFGWSTFKRIGASVSINRVYKLALTLSIVIQMSLFFIVSMMGLWIDQIYSGVFAPFSARSGLYKVVFIILFILLIPWLALGWFAVRKEQRWWMHIFILISVILLCAWGGIMFSTSFQLTFVHWRFFSTIWVMAFLLLLLTLVMGVVCRLNFGKGLAEYLQQQQEGFPEDDAEKFRPDSPAPSTLDEKDLVVSFPSDFSELPQFLPSQAAPAPLVPSKKSFYSKWGRSKASHDTPPAPRGAPPAPPSNSSYDLERGPPSYLVSSVVAVGSHGTPSYTSSSVNSSSLNSLAVLHDHEAPFTSTNSYRLAAQTLTHTESTSAVSEGGGVSIVHTLSLDNNSYSVGRDSSVAHTLSPLPGSLSRDGTVASSTMFSHHAPDMYGSPPNGSALGSSGISHRDRDTTHSRMSGASGIIATAGLSRSDTSFTGFTAHRRKGSAGTIGSFNSALDPTMSAMAHARAGGMGAMPSALMRSDTLRSLDSVRTMYTMDSGRTVGAAAGKGVTRNTSTTSTASMKPGVKPKNWTIE